MDQRNQTEVTHFIIKGITDIQELQVPVFLLILFIYLICLVCNLTIIVLVHLDPKLHTPMYFFLCNLSLLDICTTSITLPNILVSFIAGNKKVSYFNCMSQMYLFTSLESDVLLILTAMSYDRYVAICNALHYHMIMGRSVCITLAIFSWVLGCIDIIPTLWILSKYTCYKSNIINHFFCDLVPIKDLICNDTTVLDNYIFIEGGLIVFFFPCFVTFILYVFIISSILRIRFKAGRLKAFYTCSSHLTVVVLLYVTICCQYFRPNFAISLDFNKLFSLFNTVTVPILNPFIYSLKNKDVKSSFRKWIKYHQRNVVA